MLYADPPEEPIDYTRWLIFAGVVLIVISLYQTMRQQPGQRNDGSEDEP